MNICVNLCTHTLLCLFDRRLLSVVDASHKKKNGSSSKIDEQTWKVAKGEIMYARHRFIRHSSNNIFTTLCYFLGYIYRCT